MKEMQKMQSQLARIQDELATKTVEGSAGGGAVGVVVNGKQEVLEVKIRPDVVDPEDVEMLQDLVLAAVNDGLQKAQEMATSEMSKITGGLKIPGLT